MDTLTNIVDKYFMEYKWISSTINEQKSNKVCYNTDQLNNPYDEFIIEYFPRTNQYEIIVPVGSVPYKKTFTDATITSVADYIRMHLDYYKKQL